MGAAFPSLFTGLVAVAEKPSDGTRADATATPTRVRARAVRDYLLWR